MSEIAVKQSFNLSPQSLDEALRFADILATSDIIPKDFIGKPGNIIVAIQWGMELGLPPLQAMQNIAIINGRPSLWGDAVIALVRGSPLCEFISETDDGETAFCKVKRRGEDETVRTFSMTDAKTAGLTNKSGPWTQYPKRMRQMRARAFALRDVFPDVLRGMPIAEEEQDKQALKDMGPADVVSKTEGVKAEASALPVYPAEDFEKNLPAWTKAIESNKKSPEAIIATVSSKYTLTDEQKSAIGAIGAPIEAEVIAQ